MNKDDALYLNHIIAALEQIERYIRGMSESEFMSRTMVQDAVVRQIEIVSEAANCISADYQNEHPSLPWSNLAETRNRIIPESFRVNLASVWNTIQDDLPLHKNAIKKLL
ncbi:MAG: DUF86 domain-containing protein [Chloroflexi bacterium]|nr:DUF86 domain-containing protein [Chloroflexota bacterium]